MRVFHPARGSKSAQFFRMACLAAICLTISAAFGQNVINTVAGGGTIPSSAAAADIPGPTAVVEDSSGNKYVAAPESNYVWELSSSGMSTYAGLGYGHYNKVGGGFSGLASIIPLYGPSGLSIDKHNYIYVADTVNNAIRKVYLSSGVYDIKTVAGTRQGCIQSNWPTCLDGNYATAAYLSNPQGSVIDSAGDIYIADTGDNVIRVVNASTQRISLFAGSYNGGVPCGNSSDACGDGGPATQALLNAPQSVALDGQNNVYIADTVDNRIRCVLAVVGGCGDVAHAYAVGEIITVAGTGSPCTIYNDGSSSTPPFCGDGGPATAAKIGKPSGVAVTSQGVIYVADTRASLIRVISGGTISTFAGLPEAPGYNGDGGAATAAKLQSPEGVFVDASGNVLIADTGNQRIREVTSGIINTVMGGGSGGDGSSAIGANTMLANPYAVAVDASNNYYIADAANNRVRVVNTQAAPITVATVTVQPGQIATVAGTGNVGYSGDGAAATQATLNSPLGVALDSQGNIYISDSYNGWVREVNAATGVINTLQASKPTTTPAALSIDPLGNIFLADPPAQVIWEITANGIVQVAGNGNSGYSGDGGPATSAQLAQPTGVAVDANDDFYIADSNNNVIRCVLGVLGGCGDTAQKYAVGDIITYAYNGTFNFNGDGGAALSASRWDPMQVALDARGNLFVGGGQYALVQRIDALTQTVITVAGNDKDQPSFGLSGDGAASTQANLNNMGLIIDSNENLLIADNGNNRIREVPLVSVAKFSETTVTFANQSVGTTSAPQSFTLTNNGLDDLIIGSIQITGGDAGDFQQTNNCPSQLAPKLSTAQTCTINVTFTPVKKGSRSAAITFTDNGWKNPQKVSLKGTGD
ncbi:MAG TPA: choice-of-anchor D domain-containing protein [Terriglobales bacterium]